MSLRDKVESLKQIKHFGEMTFFDTYYPVEYNSAKMAPKCPNGRMFPDTLCPCSDMKEFIPQVAYKHNPLQWVRGKDHAIHMQQWMIAFPPVYVYRLGNCVYKELVKIANYGAAFFAGEYQISYNIQYTQNFVFIRFAMNTVSLQTGEEYTESMAGHLQEYFDYLSDFVQREYGLLIGTDLYGV